VVGNQRAVVATKTVGFTLIQISSSKQAEVEHRRAQLLGYELSGYAQNYVFASFHS
jgi:hypothetical protein